MYSCNKGISRIGSIITKAKNEPQKLNLTSKLHNRNYSKNYFTQGLCYNFINTNNGINTQILNSKNCQIYYQTSSIIFGGSGARPKTGVVPFNLTDVGEGIAECEVIEWYTKVGDDLKEFDLVVQVQSDKAKVEIKSPYKGKVLKVYHEIGDMAAVGSPLIDIDLGGEAPKQQKIEQKEEIKEKKIENSEKKNTKQETPSQTTSGSSFKVNGKVLATPAVRHLAKINDIDLTKVNGTGKDTRILKSDVQDFMNGKQTTTTTATSTQSSIPDLQDKVIKISGIKRMMTKTMSAAALIPHFGYNDEFEFDELIKLRKELKPIAEKENIKLSFMPFLLKACSLALKQYPELNCHTNSDCTEMTLKASHNIGVAMDTSDGLLVPNIKNIQDKSILEIASELNRLHEEGLKGKIQIEDLTGGTFSLSNIGAIGGTYASPVVFLPEVAIGALGKLKKIPKFDDNDNVVPCNIVNISWSADHRVVDGATMARFSNLMKHFIENPNSMIISMK